MPKTRDRRCVSHALQPSSPSPSSSGAAHAATADMAAPTGLHGFLLRADEPIAHDAPPHPSFAWNPFPGATGYQFQISTSSTFRDNGIVYNANNLRLRSLPSDRPPLDNRVALRALCAGARDTAAGVSPGATRSGSTSSRPRRRPRCRATRGCSVDAARRRRAPTRSGCSTCSAGRRRRSDERPGRARVLHLPPEPAGSPRCAGVCAPSARQRRGRRSGERASRRVTYGAWSPIYSSTNTAPLGRLRSTLAYTTVRRRLRRKLSGSPAHRLMPAFVWPWQQVLERHRRPSSFRVYVFTDSQCLNLVYTSAVVGSPGVRAAAGWPARAPTRLDGDRECTLRAI